VAHKCSACVSDRSDEQDAGADGGAGGAVTADNSDVSAGATLLRHRRHVDDYLSIDCDKPLNLEMNRPGARLPPSPPSDRHGTAAHSAGQRDH